MKVLLVTAPEINRRSQDAIFPPGASAYLMAKLRSIGHTVDPVDLDALLLQDPELARQIAEHPILSDGVLLDRIISGEATDPALDGWMERLARPIRGTGYGLVAISARRMPGTLLVARYLKLRFGCPVIVGGHADCTPHEFMAHSPQADWFGMGWGEATLPAVIEHVEGRRALESVPSLLYRESGEVRSTAGDDAGIEDRPCGDLKGLDPNPYLFQRPRAQVSPNPGQRLLAPVQFIKGCPHRCSFCRVAAEHGHTMSRKDPAQVATELVRYQEQGIRDVAFFNNTLSVGHEYVQQLCREFGAAGVDVHWSDSGSFTGMTVEDIGPLRAAGCIALTFGVESASPRILEKMQRHYTPAQASAILRSCHHDAGMWVQANLIVGFPGETLADFELTAGFLEAHADSVDAVAISPFYLVDSQVARQPAKFGIRLRDDRDGLGGRHLASSVAFDELDGDRMTYEAHHEEAARRADVLKERYNAARGRIRPVNDLLEIHDLYSYLPNSEAIKAAIHEGVLRFILFVGSECGNHCPDCPFGPAEPGTFDRGLDELTRGARNARDSSYGRVLVAGGEPTAHRDLPEILGMLAGLRYREIEIETDGSGLQSPEAVRRLRDLGVTRLQFKFQGRDEAAHDRVVGRPGAFQQLVRAIDHARHVGVAFDVARATWHGAWSPCLYRSRLRALRG